MESGPHWPSKGAGGTRGHLPGGTRGDRPGGGGPARVSFLNSRFLIGGGGGVACAESRMHSMQDCDDAMGFCLSVSVLFLVHDELGVQQRTCK